MLGRSAHLRFIGPLRHNTSVTFEFAQFTFPSFPQVPVYHPTPYPPRKKKRELLGERVNQLLRPGIELGPGDS